jgi:hypothetical protein
MKPAIPINPIHRGCANSGRLVGVRLQLEHQRPAVPVKPGALLPSAPCAHQHSSTGCIAAVLPGQRSCATQDRHLEHVANGTTGLHLSHWRNPHACGDSQRRAGVRVAPGVGALKKLHDITTRPCTKRAGPVDGAPFPIREVGARSGVAQPMRWHLSSVPITQRMS